jgi:hypothetical protein
LLRKKRSLSKVKNNSTTKSKKKFALTHLKLTVLFDFAKGVIRNIFYCQGNIIIATVVACFAIKDVFSVFGKKIYSVTKGVFPFRQRYYLI